MTKFSVTKLILIILFVVFFYLFIYFYSRYYKKCEFYKLYIGAFFYCLIFLVYFLETVVYKLN